MRDKHERRPVAIGQHAGDIAAPVRIGRFAQDCAECSSAAVIVDCQKTQFIAVNLVGK
jgi:hypothetical protein